MIHFLINFFIFLPFLYFKVLSFVCYPMCRNQFLGFDAAKVRRFLRRNKEKGELFALTAENLT